MARFIYALCLSVDLMLSALTFGAPWETISARLGQGRLNGSRVATWFAEGVDLIVYLFFGQDEHCEIAIAKYWARVRAVEERIAT